MAPNKNMDEGTMQDISLRGENTLKVVEVDEKRDEKEVKKEKKSKWQTIKDELRINKKLLPMKLATLGFHGGMFSFVPFLTLHMGQVGLTNEEIGLIYAILPVPSILGPLISGMLADKLKAFKAVFLCNVFFIALFHTLLVLTPLSYGNPMLTCTGVPEEPFRILNPPPCDSLNENQSYDLQQSNSLASTTVNATLEKCKYRCMGSKPTITKWCNSNGTCVEKPVGEKVQLKLGLLAPPRVISVDGAEDDGKTCNDVKIVTSDWDIGAQCLESCPLECRVEGVLDSDSWKFSTTFWVYLSLRTIAQFFASSAFTMMDAVTMAVIADKGGDYGKQRLISLICLGLMPLVSSLSINIAPLTETGNPDYSIAFYIGDTLLLVCCITMAAMEVKEVKEPVKNMFKGLKQLLAKFEIVLFLLVILVLGSNWGFLESFFLLYLRELEAPPYLLGLTMTFGCAVGIPTMIFSDRIVKKLGRPNVFILSFVAYSIRMFGYSFITNPWMSLPFEALEVITYQIMWVASVTYFPILAPSNLLATMSAISGTVHYNIGRGVGSFVGGNLMGPLGSKNTFRVFGLMSLASGLIYALVHFCYSGQKIEQNNAKEKEMHTKEGQDNPQEVKEV